MKQTLCSILAVASIATSTLARPLVMSETEKTRGIGAEYVTGPENSKTVGLLTPYQEGVVQIAHSFASNERYRRGFPKDIRLYQIFNNGEPVGYYAEVHTENGKGYEFVSFGLQLLVDGNAGDGPKKLPPHCSAISLNANSELRRITPKTEYGPNL